MKGGTEMPEKKNMLEQKNKNRWREGPRPKVTREDMVEAFACANDIESHKCDCHHTNCPYFDNCKACIVFHMSLNQFPTCQREMLEEWGVDYIGKTT